MRKAVLLLIFLTVPAFAQDDELPRPRRLSESERRHSAHPGATPNLLGCMRPGTPTYGKCKTSAQYKAEHPEPEPRSDRASSDILGIEGNPPAAIALVVFVVFGIWAIVGYARSRKA